MFDSLLRRAQVTVDNAIDQAINRVIVTTPFVIAAGFGTAALTVRMTRMFGDEMGYLIVAGIFAVIGLIVAAIVSIPRSRPAEVAGEAAAPEPEADPVKAAEAERKGAAIDSELMNTALKTMAPIALPVILRIFGRNLPLIAAILGAIFVMTRTPEAEVPPVEETPAQA